MSKAVKKLICSELEHRFTGVDAAVLIGIKGLDAEGMHDLRATLHDQGARLTIVKNSIVRIAFKNLGLPDGMDGLVDGQVGVATGTDEPTTLAKTLADWNKKNKGIEIRGALVEQNVIGAQEVADLAKLPSREQLLGMLASTLNAPASNFVSVLAGTIRGLCTALSAIGEEREKAG